MYRLSLLAVGLFTTVAFAQPSFPEPKTYPPDDGTLNEITAKTAELKAAVAELATALAKPNPNVEVYSKAAEWIVRHKEWYTEKSGKQTLDVLAVGLAHAKSLKEGKAPWLDARGKPIVRGYKSEVDGSIQPYSIQYPAEFDPKKKYRLDIVLHGRDGTLTEVKFLAAKAAAKADPKLDHFVLEVYGRGNNAYRWAGETDVREALEHFGGTMGSNCEISHKVLRGFSMGGAGTWHLGLHDPARYSVIGPGAGFTTTRGYIKNLKEPLPEYIDKCLHIYDAVDYAENAFGVPVVAYSGEKDAQKAAADNIEMALKGFKEPYRFKHLVAPGLEHQQPAAWMAKCEAEYRAILSEDKTVAERVRFVTYTSKYFRAAEWLWVYGLGEQYSKAVADAKIDKAQKTVNVTTTNVRCLILHPLSLSIKGIRIDRVAVDGDAFQVKFDSMSCVLLKSHGKWDVSNFETIFKQKAMAPGPIDDAFRGEFVVVRPSGQAWHPAVGEHIDIVEKQFGELWDKHLRGKLPTGKWGDAGNAILFGDPGSNPAIAEVLPNLPIKWTKDELLVNGVKYDPKTHYPALIYPHPKFPGQYVVLNSGHTFKDADFRGTNALLYPRLGDWAVLKPKPTRDDPGAVEVVAAGIFDEFWQFKKEKK